MKRLIGISALAAATVAASVAAAPASPRAAGGGVTVFAGPNLAAPPPGVSKQADVLAFFPSSVTVHVGDTVTWQFRGFHTVTFPGTKKPYPFIAPVGGKEPVTKDAAGKQFWWGGKVPLLGVSPLSLAPQGPPALGSASQIASSGLVRILTAPANKPPAPFELRFTKAGTYHYQCAVHPGMRGIVRVLPASAPVTSPAAAASQGKAQLQRTIGAVKQLAHTKPSAPLTVDVGAGNGPTGGEITAFFPATLHVKVGQTVHFVNHDPTDIHTVTFGPEAYRSKIEKTFAAPHGKQVLLNPLGGFSSDPPSSTPLRYGGTNHGNGYVNSGVLQPKGSPKAAGPQSFALTFTKPGTYKYECVIHTNMDGTIVVS